MTSETEEKTTENWLKEAQKGYIRMGVLILLSKKPSHGYEIMKEINSRTRGFWQPTPGGVYPILRDLEKCGYVKGQWQTQKNRRLKVYKITKAGDLILRRAIVKQAEISDNIGNLFREFARDVLNIENATKSMPNLPSFFTPFLEDNPYSEENLKHLEHERQHTYELLKSMQERLRKIDARLKEIKKQSQNGSSPVPLE
ncbi:MAG TPA: PadR family transcriptional regulator [Candidatus Acidoferrales bacterium]|nr:PadR family transcriptional regulator [Candidatus Acidoferrales bacterium]